MTMYMSVQWSEEHSFRANHFYIMNMCARCHVSYGGLCETVILRCVL